MEAGAQGQAEVVFCVVLDAVQGSGLTLCTHPESRGESKHTSTTSRSVCWICVEFDELGKGLGLIREETSRIHVLYVCVSA